jgi:hypothetical protein
VEPKYFFRFWIFIALIVSNINSKAKF